MVICFFFGIRLMAQGKFWGGVIIAVGLGSILLIARIASKRIPDESDKDIWEKEEDTWEKENDEGGS